MTDRRAMLCLAVLVGVGPFPLPASRFPQDTTRGKAVYEKWCASCHGEGGAGDGPAARYMLPRPRDFTAALYQIRTTASGQLPTDADIMAVMAKGIPGTTMPGWETRLSKQDRVALLTHLKSFSAFFADSSQQPEPLAFGRAPGGGEAAVRTGRQFYDSIGCRKCHGDLGRGDGPSAPTLDDDFGAPIFAADLSQNWRFNGGGTVDAIYRRLRTGLDGTPMPSFSDLIDQQFLTDEELWRLAQYVHSLSPERPPQPAEVIRAPQRAGPLPAAPDDSGWADVERYWVPLVGQIIRKPRWFTPAVTGVWVQAVHDGATLALRVTWHDRSQSPDTAWLEFAGKVLAAVAGDDSVPPAADPWPDQVAVQFPRRLADGMERPYFLMGSSSDPVYQWRWTSAPGGAVAGLARGLERFERLPGARVAAQATYDRGEWRVVFTRALATADTANELVFRTGRAIPIALFAWDGSMGEAGARSAVSSWYSLALERPTPLGVFVSPVIAMALTLGLGLVVVRRAQRRGEGGRGKGEG